MRTIDVTDFSWEQVAQNSFAAEMGHREIALKRKEGRVWMIIYSPDEIGNMVGGW